jgi:ammonia channel protein AmtB
MNARLIDWCLTSTLAVFQLYRGVLMLEDNGFRREKGMSVYLTINMMLMISIVKHFLWTDIE